MMYTAGPFRILLSAPGQGADGENLQFGYRSLDPADVIRSDGLRNSL